MTLVPWQHNFHSCNTWLVLVVCVTLNLVRLNLTYNTHLQCYELCEKSSHNQNVVPHAKRILNGIPASWLFASDVSFLLDQGLVNEHANSNQPRHTERSLAKINISLELRENAYFEKIIAVLLLRR